MVEGLNFRVGTGFDVHPFSDDAGRELVLGGVRFSGERGLAGHSDADVIAHAAADALLGAAGLGDLGEHFPASDGAWSGADSLGLLREVTKMLTGAGWVPLNVDCTVAAETPALASSLREMARLLSDAAEAPVTVKAKRTEGVGAVGRGEGIACWAVALVNRVE